MRLFNRHKKWVALAVAFTFLYLVELKTLPLDTEKVGAPEETSISASHDTPNLVEKESETGYKVKKRGFPWLWVILGVVLIAGGVYYYMNYVQKMTLTVNMGEGVEGTPDTGSYEYKRSDSVSYNYALLPGYKNMVVTLDGSPVAASGSIKMKKSHTLSAIATKEVTLIVNIDAGVNGTPATGTYTYEKGQTASYSYSLKSGFTNLVVQLDGTGVGNTGTITMDADHTLTATTTGQRKLTVSRGTGVDGSPVSGVFSYSDGAVVSYSYSTKVGYYGLGVKLDGGATPASGTVTMNADHTLASTAIYGVELEWLLNGNAVDTSGKGKHGTVFNATSTTNRKGYSSQAYYFNGSNAYIQGPNFVAQWNKCVSISLWVKIPGTSVLRYFLEGNGFGVTQNGTNIGFAVHVSATDTATCAVPTNTWVHIVGTYDGSNIRIYRNGILMDTESHPGTPYNPGWNFTIGKRATTADYWKGYVDDVRVYSYTLTQAEISKLTSE